MERPHLRLLTSLRFFEVLGSGYGVGTFVFIEKPMRRKILDPFARDGSVCDTR